MTGVRHARQGTIITEGRSPTRLTEACGCSCRQSCTVIPMTADTGLGSTPPGGLFALFASCNPQLCGQPLFLFAQPLRYLQLQARIHVSRGEAAQAQNLVGLRAGRHLDVDRAIRRIDLQCRPRHGIGNVQRFGSPQVGAAPDDTGSGPIRTMTYRSPGSPPGSSLGKPCPGIRSAMSSSAPAGIETVTLSRQRPPPTREFRIGGIPLR